MTTNTLLKIVIVLASAGIALSIGSLIAFWN